MANVDEKTFLPRLINFQDNIAQLSNLCSIGHTGKGLTPQSHTPQSNLWLVIFDCQNCKCPQQHSHIVQLYVIHG